MRDVINCLIICKTYFGKAASFQNLSSLFIVLVSFNSIMNISIYLNH